MTKKKGITLLIVILFILVALITFTFVPFQLGLYDYNPPISSIPLGIELSGGVYVVFEASVPEVDGEPMYDRGELDSHIKSTIKILQDRLSAAGYTEATVTVSGQDKIRVEVADVGTGNVATEDVFNIIGKPAVLEFRKTSGDVILSGQGGDIVSAEVGYNSQNQEYGVYLKLSPEGTKKFAEATKDAIGSTIGIYLDDEQISNPRVSSAITDGSPVITGSFTFESATALAAQIQGGALTVNLAVTEQSNISPTLGVNAINSSLIAGAIGLALIFIFLFFVYGGFGIVATIALSFYVTMVIFVLGSTSMVQLSLAGIAGIVLSIGMAVDANVIIFERIKDEYSMGKNIPDAVSNGFRKSLSAILDANITTIIASVVLIVLGTATIKAFAVTLLVGIIVSLFTALIISRLLANVFLSFSSTDAKFYKLSREVEKNA